MKHAVKTQVEMADIEHERLFAQMNGLYNTIEKYGVSRPMMEAVDPNGELIEKGFFTSYDELPLEATKGEASEEVLGTILVIIGISLGAAIISSIRNFDYFKSAADVFDKRILKYSNKLSHILELQKHNLIGMTQFSEAIGSDWYIYNKRSFYIIMKLIPHLITVGSKHHITDIIRELNNKLNSGSIDDINIADINRRLFDILSDVPKQLLSEAGISIILSGSNLNIKHTEDDYDNDEFYDETMNDKNWKIGDVRPVINLCQSTILNKTDEFGNELRNMANISSTLATTLKSLGKKKIDSSEKARYKEMLNMINDVLKVAKQFFSITTTKIETCLETAIGIGEISVGEDMYNGANR